MRYEPPATLDASLGTVFTESNRRLIEEMIVKLFR
jgi:hypothetical protein